MSSVEQQGILAAGQVISTLCINLPLLAAGLFIAPRLNLGAPVLDRLLHGRPLEAHLRRGLGIGLGLGLISGILLIGLAYLVEPVVNAELAAYNITLPENINPPAWSGFLASISAAITEETMLRLFGLSLVAWIGRALLDRRGGVPSLPVLWGANVLVALVFGALHFPNMMMFGALTPLVMVQILLMNGLIGVLFGWLYWKYGLESAMIAHFSVDIVLHVLAVFLPA
jgi:hypothetical protein